MRYVKWSLVIAYKESPESEISLSISGDWGIPDARGAYWLMPFVAINRFRSGWVTTRQSREPVLVVSALARIERGTFGKV